MKLFDRTTFYTTVNHLKDLPDSDAEVVFVGRSNAGKSSVINTLTRQTRLAFVSKTPGRTQHINFFELGNPLNTKRCYIVDMPGYGFAKASRSVREHWVHLLGDYLQTRKGLIGLVLIMDCRHPMKPLDVAMLNFFSMRQQPIHILLSKSDKLSHQQQNQMLKTVDQVLSVYPRPPQITVQLFSSLKKQGMDQVESTLASWFDSANQIT